MAENELEINNNENKNNQEIIDQENNLNNEKKEERNEERKVKNKETFFQSFLIFCCFSICSMIGCYIRIGFGYYKIWKIETNYVRKLIIFFLCFFVFLFVCF